MHRHQLPNSYAIVMAVLPEQRDVILIGQPTGKGTPACIAAIGLDAPHQLKGPWVRPRTTTVSCLAVLSGQQQFAVGELAFALLLCHVYLLCLASSSLHQVILLRASPRCPVLLGCPVSVAVWKIKCSIGTCL